MIITVRAVELQVCMHQNPGCVKNQEDPRAFIRFIETSSQLFP